ncbi:MAG: hypothetical protein AAF974_08390 [Cyanobacteria bacterium P01_E01_bin.34]
MQRSPSVGVALWMVSDSLLSITDRKREAVACDRVSVIQSWGRMPDLQVSRRF